MILVKVKARSIRKNANAFNTVSFANSTKDTTIRMNGLPPSELIENEDYIIIEISGIIGEPESLVTEIRLIKNRPTTELREIFKDCKGLQITVSSERHKIDHLPEQEYFYSYLNPKVKCSECKETCNLNDILNDEETAEDICPNCFMKYTFSYRYESIENALVRLKIK